MNDEMRRMAWKMEKLQEMRSAAAEMLATGIESDTVRANVCYHLAWWAPAGITCREVRDMTEWVMADALGVEEKK